MSRRASRRLRVLALALSLAAAVTVRAQRDALVIADFDEGRAETKGGLSLWPYADDQFGGTSEAQATLIHPGAEGSDGALRISLRVAGDSPAPFAGAWAMMGRAGLATDVSAYRGLRFYARSKDATAFAAGIVRFPGQIRRYTAPFDVRPEWAIVELPFDKFRQVLPPGAPAADSPPLDPKDVTSVGITVAPQRRGEVQIDIDRVEFYR